MTDGIDDTIVAVSSPIGAGWRSVVRLTGDSAPEIAARLVSEEAILHPPGRGGRSLPVTLRLPDGRRIRADIFVMSAPRSYTGEDTIELHLTGSHHVAETVVAALIAAGARVAAPGEFTRRAVLNGKMDIIAAEAVLSAIQATNVAESSAAADVLTGRYSGRIASIEGEIYDILADTEASLDFTDHDVPEADRRSIANRLSRVRNDLGSWLADESSEKGGYCRYRVLLFGPVNGGKSTLFNRLTGSPNAIASDVAGTTRDLLEYPIVVDRLPITLIDSAGQWEFPSGPDALAVAMAREAMRSSDLVLVVLDVEDPRYERIAPALVLGACIVVFNKIDRCGTIADGRRAAERVASSLGIADHAAISAREGWEVEELRARIASAIRERPASVAGGRATMFRRWSDTLRRTDRALTSAAETIARGGELAVVAVELSAAASAIGEMTGKTPREEVLDRIFNRFCIGK